MKNIFFISLIFFILVSCGKNKDGKLIEIYSLTGRKLIAKEIKQGVSEFEIDLSIYSSGVYLLKIYSHNGATSTTKLIR